MFLTNDKFAIVIANGVFNKVWIGMDNHPDVQDDMRNIMQTVKMMGIIEENTFCFENISHEQVTALYADIEGKIYARTRELKDETGFCGMNRL